MRDIICVDAEADRQGRSLIVFHCSLFRSSFIVSFINWDHKNKPLQPYLHRTFQLFWSIKQILIIAGIILVVLMPLHTKTDIILVSTPIDQTLFIKVRWMTCLHLIHILYKHEQRLHLSLHILNHLLNYELLF